MGVSVLPERPRARRRLRDAQVRVADGPAAGLTGMLAIGVLSLAGGWALANFGVLVVGRVRGPYVVLGLPLLIVLGTWAISRPLVGVGLVLVAFPVGLLRIPGVNLTVVQVLAAGATLAVVMHRLALGKGPLPWMPQMWWALALVGVALFATPSALSLTLAFNQDINLIAGMLLALAVVAGCRTMRDLRVLVWLLLLAGLVMSLETLAAIQATKAQAGGALVTDVTSGPFSEHNQLGSFSAAIILVAVGVLLSKRGFGERLASLVIGGLALVAMLLSLSRGAWIGFAAGGLLMVVLLPQARQALIVVGVPLIVGAAFYGALAPSSPQVTIVTDRLASIATPSNNPYDDRPAIWREASREILQDPWSGQGPGAFPVASTHAASSAITLEAQHAHNVLLTVAAEIGVPAVGLVIGFTLALGQLVRRTVRTLRSTDVGSAALVAGIGGGLTAFLGQGLVDFTLRNPLLFMLLWALVGMALTAGKLAAADEAPSGAA